MKQKKKRAAKTARISLFNIQRPNQTLQRDSSPPFFHFLTGYFFWSDLDSQNLIFVFHFQPNRNMKGKQREERGKNSREKENWQNLFIHHPFTRRHDTNTQLHKAFKISPTPHTDPFHNFHSERKLTHFTICVNSHSPTHEHKITSTHTPIYNPHAPRAYFRAKSKRERGEVWIWNHSQCLRWQMVLVEALGRSAHGVRFLARAIRCWVGLARPI